MAPEWGARATLPAAGATRGGEGTGCGSWELERQSFSFLRSKVWVRVPSSSCEVRRPVALGSGDHSPGPGPGGCRSGGGNGRHSGLKRRRPGNGAWGFKSPPEHRFEETELGRSSARLIRERARVRFPPSRSAAQVFRAACRSSKPVGRVRLPRAAAWGHSSAGTSAALATRRSGVRLPLAPICLRSSGAEQRFRKPPDRVRLPAEASRRVWIVGAKAAYRTVYPEERVRFPHGPSGPGPVGAPGLLTSGTHGVPERR